MLFKIGQSCVALMKQVVDETVPPPDGSYEFKIAEEFPEPDREKGPACTYSLEVINNPTYNGKKLRYFCQLPNNGDITGVYRLTELLTALKMSYSGEDFDSTTLLQKTFKANIALGKPDKVTKKRYCNITSFI